METKEQILQILQTKSLVKQKVFDNTLDVFNVIKAVLQETQRDFNLGLAGADARIHLEYKDNGRFETQLKAAGDLIVFYMHSNTFEFNREHSIWKTPFATQDPLNTYCGIINIYNFLADSFRYQRLDDPGYLIGRIFVNKDFYFMVEGKRQLGVMHNMLGLEKIDREKIKEIIHSAILYALEFDLLVPPYDLVKIISVAQMNENIENSKLQTGKRLGFVYNSDDVSPKNTKL
jgi:hypothetical protein